MSDSFADLWNSSAPTKPNEIRTLGALSSASNQNVRKPTNDVFSMLAATSSSSSVNSRSTTPSHIGRSQVLPPGTGAVKPLQKSSSTSVDAFSNLLSPTFASSSKNGTNLTIAQRAAQVEKQRSGQLRNSIQTAEPQLDASTWAGLDALGAKPANIGKPQPNAIEDDWTSTFTTSSKPGNIVSSRPSQVPATTTVDDDWGLHDFGGKVSTSDKVASHTPPKTLLDFDPFSSPLSKSNEPSSDLHPQRSNTPGDFDFGDREDGLLNEQSDGEDDILGDLAKPVETTRRPSVSL